MLSFLKAPGNSCFTDRIVQINGVKHKQQERTIWAALVGVAQFAQHFDGYRPRANCILEFDPSRGFNNDGAKGAAGVSAAVLRLKLAPRNGAGVSAGSPLLLNYGVSFDFSASRAGGNSDKSTFKGALEALFESQRARLPEEAAANTSKAAHEAEESEKAAQQAEDRQKQEEEEQKRKREQAKEDEEQEAKRRRAAEQERQAAEEAAAGGDGATKAKMEHILGEISNPSAAVGLRAGQIVIGSHEDTSKKTPRTQS